VFPENTSRTVRPISDRSSANDRCTYPLDAFRFENDATDCNCVAPLASNTFTLIKSFAADVVVSLVEIRVKKLSVSELAVAGSVNCWYIDPLSEFPAVPSAFAKYAYPAPVRDDENRESA
jgi:hypothetical protein